jgi:hypothetical protein
MRSAKAAQSVATGRAVCWAGCLVGQHMPRRPFTACLHLVKKRVVGSLTRLALHGAIPTG